MSYPGFNGGPPPLPPPPPDDDGRISTLEKVVHEVQGTQATMMGLLVRIEAVSEVTAARVARLDKERETDMDKIKEIRREVDHWSEDSEATGRQAAMSGENAARIEAEKQAERLRRELAEKEVARAEREAAKAEQRLSRAEEDDRERSRYWVRYVVGTVVLITMGLDGGGLTLFIEHLLKGH